MLFFIERDGIHSDADYSSRWGIVVVIVVVVVVVVVTKGYIENALSYLFFMVLCDDCFESKLLCYTMQTGLISQISSFVIVFHFVFKTRRCDSQAFYRPSRITCGLAFART